MIEKEFLELLKRLKNERLLSSEATNPALGECGDAPEAEGIPLRGLHFRAHPAGLLLPIFSESETRSDSQVRA